MNRVLLGRRHPTLPLPWFVFKRILRNAAGKIGHVLENLGDEHRRVRHFIVKTLAEFGKPMPSDYIADRLELDQNWIVRILAGLELRLAYRFRGVGQDEIWAYPITAEPNPQVVFFSSGQIVYAPFDFSRPIPGFNPC